MRSRDSGSASLAGPRFEPGASTLLKPQGETNRIIDSPWHHTTCRRCRRAGAAPSVRYFGRNLSYKLPVATTAAM